MEHICLEFYTTSQSLPLNNAMCQSLCEVILKCREQLVEIRIKLIVNTPFVHFTNFTFYTYWPIIFFVNFTSLTTIRWWIPARTHSYMRTRLKTWLIGTGVGFEGQSFVGRSVFFTICNSTKQKIKIENKLNFVLTMCLMKCKTIVNVMALLFSCFCLKYFFLALW